jgi:CMP-N,N'-diacetyllegionaminic acid synthase
MSSIRSTSALAVIIGRAGSKGLPGKNAKAIAGKPMICHTIEDALNSRRVDRIIVSTDGQAIAAAAESMNIEVVRRPPELANDVATVDAAVRHAVTAIGAAEPLIVILYANVPVRPDDLIDRAIEELVRTGAGSVQSYSEVGKHHPYWMVTLDDQQRITPHVQNAVYRRQDLPKLLLPNGGVIAVTRQSLFTIVENQPHAFLGRDRRGIVSPEGSVIDVDTPADCAMAEAILLKEQNRLAKVPS